MQGNLGTRIHDLVGGDIRANAYEVQTIELFREGYDDGIFLSCLDERGLQAWERVGREIDSAWQHLAAGVEQPLARLEAGRTRAAEATTPTRATQVDEGLAGAATGPPAGQPQPARSGIPRLPEELTGAKLRFGFRNRNVSLNFKNDVGRALYVVAQTRPSKQDADFMAWLRNVLPGMSDDEIRGLGQQIRGRVKRIVENAPNATRVDVPSTGLFRRGGPARPGFATVGLVRGVTRAGIGAVAGSVAGAVTAENPEDRLGRAILGAVGGATVVVGTSAGRACARQLSQPDGAARRSLLRELHPDGVLDRVTADLDRQRRQLQSAEVRRVRNIAADLRRALKAEFRTDRWTELPEQVRTAVRQAMQQDPADTVDMERRGELPQSLADAIVAARNHVDALSRFAVHWTPTSA